MNLHITVLFNADGILQRPGDLVNTSVDGIHRVTKGNYAYFEVRHQKM